MYKHTLRATDLPLRSPPRRKSTHRTLVPSSRRSRPEGTAGRPSGVPGAGCSQVPLPSQQPPGCYSCCSPSWILCTRAQELMGHRREQAFSERKSTAQGFALQKSKPRTRWEKAKLSFEAPCPNLLSARGSMTNKKAVAKFGKMIFFGGGRFPPGRLPHLNFVFRLPLRRVFLYYPHCWSRQMGC